MMRAVMIAAALVLAVICTKVQADFLTPFVGSSTGTTDTFPGWIIEARQSDVDNWIVLVNSDTMQFIPLRATADASVVKPEYVGRRVRITAEMLDPVDGDGSWSTVRILNVEPIE